MATPPDLQRAGAPTLTLDPQPPQAESRPSTVFLRAAASRGWPGQARPRRWRNPGTHPLLTQYEPDPYASTRRLAQKLYRRAGGAPLPSAPRRRKIAEQAIDKSGGCHADTA